MQIDKTSPLENMKYINLMWYIFLIQMKLFNSVLCPYFQGLPAVVVIITAPIEIEEYGDEN